MRETPGIRYYRSRLKRDRRIYQVMLVVLSALLAASFWLGFASLRSDGAAGALEEAHGLTELPRN